MLESWSRSQKTWFSLSCQWKLQGNTSVFQLGPGHSKSFRVFLGLEQLSSTIYWGAMGLVRQLKYACIFPDFQVRYVCRPAANVLVGLIAPQGFHTIWAVCLCASHSFKIKYAIQCFKFTNVRYIYMQIISLCK